MKCTPSARVENFSIRKANQGLLIIITNTSQYLLTLIPARMPKKISNTSGIGGGISVFGGY